MDRTRFSTPPSTDPRARAGAAILRGMAYALDLGATLRGRGGRFTRGPAGDAEALRADWMRAVERAASDPAP